MKKLFFLLFGCAGLIRYQKLAIYETTLNRGIAINVGKVSRIRNNQCWVIMSSYLDSLGRVCSIYIKTSVMDVQVRLHKISLDFENFQIATNQIQFEFYNLQIINCGVKLRGPILRVTSSETRSVCVKQATAKFEYSSLIGQCQSLRWSRDTF